MFDAINGRNRIIAAVLALLLFVSVLAACADSGQKAGSETGAALSGTEETEADTRVYHDLPEISFDGYTFNSMYWEVAGWSNLYQDVFSEVETGDLLNDAVYTGTGIQPAGLCRTGIGLSMSTFNLRQPGFGKQYSCGAYFAHVISVCRMCGLDLI